MAESLCAPQCLPLHRTNDRVYNRTHHRYLFEVPAACTHKHHRMLPVGISSDGCHPVHPVLEKWGPLDHTEPPKRLVQDQTAEIIIYLHRLKKNKNSSTVFRNSSSKSEMKLDESQVKKCLC